jgi:hypothetical protein
MRNATGKALMTVGFAVGAVGIVVDNVAALGLGILATFTGVLIWRQR